MTKRERMMVELILEIFSAIDDYRAVDPSVDHGDVIQALEAARRAALLVRDLPELVRDLPE